MAVWRWAGASLVVAMAGCAHYGAEFMPAPGTQVIGIKDTGESTSAGVTVAVSGQRWGYDPGDLGALVTPMQVTITNRSGQPVRVRYDQFSVTDPNGVTQRALSPFEIQRPGTDVYGPWGGWGGGFYGPWAYSGIWGPYYYAPFYDEEPLPSRDMLQKALPEGVLANNGSVTGYVYFPYISKDVGQVRVTADLLSAQTAQRVAEITVPFLAKG